MNKIIALLIAALLLALPLPALAEEEAAIDISGGAVVIYDSYYEQNGKKYNFSGNCAITGSSETADATVTIAAKDCTVTLSSLSINTALDTEDACAFSVLSGSSVRLTLKGESTIKSGGLYAGIAVPEGASLAITAESGGSLAVTGGNAEETGGAGIGGSAGQTAGSITISGGTIDAFGGAYAAGIGGADCYYGAKNDPSVEITETTDISGLYGNGGSITIECGFITATGGHMGAGIGGGYGGNGGSITISGGTAAARGGSCGSGVGGGYRGDGGTVLITGGDISANSPYLGAGIGGGQYAGGGDISVSGGNVTAVSDIGGAGIGGGQYADGGTINISGGSVRASSVLYGAGVGGGEEGGGGTVNLLGGTLDIQGGMGGAGVGGGKNGSGGEVLLTAKNCSVAAGAGGETIGAGENGADSGTLKRGGILSNPFVSIWLFIGAGIAAILVVYALLRKKRSRAKPNKSL